MATMDNLVQQVQDLENATTDLLDATNLSKQTLDKAVDSATGSAGSAKTDASTATTAKNESVQARNESVAAKDEAEAIVHKGEGSTTPGGGKYPVAYADGQIDSGWLPLLQAMYPYSGVIGSVDKGDLFTFYSNQDSSWANDLVIKARQFNINGRFVNKQQETITLPDAEDTAARAVAFDDLFIDWNGNITHYRSITPHRTTTGYDADAIATEHGYTKVQTGLYKTGDTYALLLGRVARRNKGAYHPLWNPEGANRARAQVSDTSGRYYGFPFYSVNSKTLSSEIDAFDLTKIGASPGDRTDPDAITSEVNFYGSIKGSFPTQLGGNPDNLKYDAIYADDFTPLYYSAQNVIDRQALLFDSFNKAVAGETFMGAEGNVVSQWPEQDTFEDNIIDYSPIELTAVRGTYGGVVDGEPRFLANSVGIEETVLEITKLDPAGDTESGCQLDVRVDGQEYRSNSVRTGETTIFHMPRGSLSYLAVYNSTGALKIKIIKGGLRNNSARPQFLAVDIIGSLDAMPQEWLDHGLPGNWLAVGEEGENLIPDGTEKNFKLNRKCFECYLALRTDNKGVTWSDHTSSWKEPLEGSANARNANPLSMSTYMLFYRTAANPFELSERLRSINASDQVRVASSNQTQNTALFMSNMINKVPVGTDLNISQQTSFFKRLDRNHTEGTLARANNEHSPFSTSLGNSVLPLMKVFPYLSLKDNAFALMAVFKEIKTSESKSGDDNQFNIVDNQSTTTDLNGEEVIVGQKRAQLPYHFDGDTL